MAEFAARLSLLRGMDRPVVDQTGIAGYFDIVLKGAASDGQIILLTLSENLAAAAAAAGARRIDLDGPARPARNGSSHAKVRAGARLGASQN